jgi:DNA-binding XRE family transcriptional regulator
MLTSGPQLRAGRAMAGLTREALAAAADVGTTTITRLEGEGGRLRSTLATLDGLTKALARHGVAFTEDGVRALRDIPPPRR